MVNKKLKNSVDKHFKTALPGAVVAGKAIDHLKTHGVTPKNTIYAQSSCPDELNHDNYQQDISRILRDAYGEVFHLGGLAGVPFTGKTGWGAFSHHLPVDGNIVLLFAPHVGVNAEGTVGKVRRPGMEKDTSSCGSAIGAYNHIQKMGVKDKKAKHPGHDHRLLKVETDHDFQQSFMVATLNRTVANVDAKKTANEKMTQLAL
jgi:hypothetical protein